MKIQFKKSAKKSSQKFYNFSKKDAKNLKENIKWGDVSTKLYISNMKYIHTYIRLYEGGFAH